ncbi:MAG TPA: hypothetical protein EYQ00_04225, partial [Dehalococcoidia bacterium]|nr:hypothetical protein [Dehalococcoidia bacterium]
MNRLVNQITSSSSYGFILAVVLGFCSLSMFTKYVAAQALPTLEEDDDFVISDTSDKIILDEVRNLSHEELVTLIEDSKRKELESELGIRTLKAANDA